MANRLDGEIDIQVRPIEMIGRRSLDAGEFVDGGLTEPWELLERQEQLFIGQEQPEAMPRDMGNLRSQNDGAKHP